MFPYLESLGENGDISTTSGMPSITDQCYVNMIILATTIGVPHKGQLLTIFFSFGNVWKNISLY